MVNQLSLLLLITAIVCTASAVEIYQKPQSTTSQVAIRIQTPVNDTMEDFHLCNGVIVDSYYVVTSASCLENMTTTNGTQIYVAAGHLVNGGSAAGQLNYTVNSVAVHPKFPAEEEHNIALIKLLNPLPSPAIVTIPQSVVVPNTCSVIIRNEDSVGAYFEFFNDLRLAPDNYCPNSNITGDDDHDEFYCYQYPLPAEWCNLSREELKTHSDLGSALICNGLYTGILSELQYPEDRVIFNCDEPRKTYGRYTSLDEHREWMYSVMGPKPTDPTDPDDGDKSGAITLRQSAGVLMIAAAVYIFLYM